MTVKTMSTALVRHLRRFVEFDLSGVASWGNTTVSVKAADCVQAAIWAHGVGFVVRVQGPDADPKHPCGQVFLDGQPMGAIDDATWRSVGSRIRAAAAAPTAQAANG